MHNDIVQGIVISGIGGLYSIEKEDGQMISCRARGRFRRDGIQIMVGDHVRVAMQQTGLAVIDEILPRKNALQRPAVANVDTLLVIISQAPPVTPEFLIDKVSAIAGHKGVEMLVCINKCDIEHGEKFERIYKNAGFTVIRTSARTGEGIDQLRDRLKNGIFVLTGNSGVGKSSIVNCIDPAWKAQTGEISERIGRGRQTTRHVELYKLPGGAYIADTPGFSSFDVERMDLVLRDDLQHAFREFAPYIPMCRYRGCTHRKEQGCAVRQALENGNIEQSRYDSYLMLFESMKQINPWDIKRE